MLVLTRRIGESIWIAPDITVTVIRLESGQVRIGIDAPPETLILRQELARFPAGPGGDRGDSPEGDGSGGGTGV